MPKYAIEAEYFCATTGILQLPEGKTWDDIADGWYIKWDMFHFAYKDAPEVRFRMKLDSDIDNIIDWKRPIRETVYRALDDETVDYSEEIEEQL